MIIVSQDKTEIVNFDNVINVQFLDIDGDYVISATAVVGTDDIYRELGYYKTEERAKEVLKDIVNKYKQFNFDKNQAVTILPKVYEMPKE
ncbi:MAG: hypothetical protein IJV31_02545 [Clostridia bacterium]|nr:hypothetical protein [Clostridia bacterium]